MADQVEQEPVNSERRSDRQHRPAALQWAVPAGAVLACAAAAVLLTDGLRPTVTPRAPTAATPAGRLDAAAAGGLAELLPTEREWGTGWVRDNQAPWQQLADGPGLLHPCGRQYPSDGKRGELVRRNVKQDDREVPVGSAMTYEIARYAAGGAQQALAERLAGLRDCPTYRTTFAGLSDSPVDVGLLAPPAGGDAGAAHVTVTAHTSVGRQAVEYTLLVARQGDVLLTALVGNGNGTGPDLDAFAGGYFETARQKLAGLPHPSPEQLPKNPPAGGAIDSAAAAGS